MLISEQEQVRSHRQALGAQQPNTVLILDTSVGLGMQSREAIHATAMGYNVELATAADWNQKTTSDFATYRAIILGDTGCDLNVIAAAQNTANIWGPAVTGNALVAGNTPNSHLASGSDVFIAGAVQFAAADPSATGAYISLSCYYHWNAGPMTPVPLLSGLGSFTVKSPALCYNDAHQVATHPSMSLVPDSHLSNWSCSANAIFETFPADFQPFAIVEDHIEAFSLSFPDGSVGVPYIVARGAPQSLCGNGFVDPGELCDDGNYITGDTCSEKCLPNALVCGDWDLDLGEQCDDGNSVGGDGCSADCQLEIPAPIGACCLSGGGCMEAMSPDDCDDIGVFTADQLTCNDVAPECIGLLGACCLPQGGCMTEAAAIPCTEMGGLYLGDGSDCNDEGLVCPFPPELGACCIYNGGCLDNLSPALCNENGGAYLGNGSACANEGLMCVGPEIGACCVNGGCAEMTAGQCAQAGGTYAGSGSICDEDTCPGCTEQPIGACCVDGTCLMLSASACFLNGGMYGGDGSICNSETCDCGNDCCEELASGCSVGEAGGSKGNAWLGLAAAALSAGWMTRRRRSARSAR